MTYSTDEVSSHQYEAKRIRADGEAGAALAQTGERASGLYGFIPIPTGGTTVTNELVNELREELGI